MSIGENNQGLPNASLDEIIVFTQMLSGVASNMFGYYKGKMEFDAV